MRDLDHIFSLLKELKKDELKLVSQRIMSHLKGADHIPTNETPVVNTCRKCGEKDCISKFGKDKNGKQRYRCKRCGTVFTDTSYSVVSNTHCSLEQWEKYIRLLIQGASIQKCADACGISARTAFIWRHKILASLQQDQSNRFLNGIVETDDMFVAVSYKGNHKKSTRFSLPRKPHKRGSDDKVGPYGRACVLCAVERGGQSYGEVVGLGTVSQPMLEYAFKERLGHDAVVVADRAYSIKSYFNRTPIELIQVASHVGKQASPPQIKGSFHIQNVNNMHNRIRRFLRPYNGVSTKYLNHYINLFVWIENHKKNNQETLDSAMSDYISTQNTYTRSADIFSLPPVPSVA